MARTEQTIAVLLFVIGGASFAIGAFEVLGTGGALMLLGGGAALLGLMGLAGARRPAAG